MNAIAEPSILSMPIGQPRSDVTMQYQPDIETVWAFMQPRGVPCFSLTLLRAIRAQDAVLEAEPGYVAHEGAKLPVRYYVGGSRVPGVYSYGGDLSLFLTLIRARDREALRAYAARCLDCLWARITNFGAKNLTTIALVQGAAFGGGWESVLGSDVIIAEEGARFSFPEIKFNLFPGMGAYSLLARRVGAAHAQRIITGEKTYSAREVFDMGLVDAVVEDGKGEAYTYQWIRKHGHRANGLRGVHAARDIVTPVSRAELDAIADQWVDTAVGLTDMDLRVMNRFLIRQHQSERPRERTAEASTVPDRHEAALPEAA